MKRFYKDVGVERRDGGWQVTLDRRAIRTQGGRAQIVPTEALARLMAEEWRGQGETIDPRSFFHRDLADFALDEVASAREPAIAKLLQFAETDTLCYRAEPGHALHARQTELWEPLVTGREARLGARFERVSGVVHRPQPAATLAALRGELESKDDFALAALTTLASLSASLIVALAAEAGEEEPAALFAAANCEEDWQAGLWGWDHEAERGRALRCEAFASAAAFAAAARAGSTDPAGGAALDDGR